MALGSAEDVLKAGTAKTVVTKGGTALTVVGVIFDCAEMCVAYGSIVAVQKELNDARAGYEGLVKAIVATGYKGYLGQEFIPKRDPVKSLTEAFKTCDV